MVYFLFYFQLWAIIFTSNSCKANENNEDKTMCPTVETATNFTISSILGSWEVIQYYAISENDVLNCMKAEFSMPHEDEIKMSVSFKYADNPGSQIHFANTTWAVRDVNQSSHWTNWDILNGVTYNTYVLEFRNNYWAVLLHCTEMRKRHRFISGLILSKKSTLVSDTIENLRYVLSSYITPLDYMRDPKNCTS